MKAQITQCLVDACGAPGARPNGTRVLFNVLGDQTPTQIWIHEFKPRLEEMIEREQADDMYLNRRAHDVLVNGGTVDPKSAGYMFLVFYTLLKRLSPHLAEFIDLQNWPFHFAVKEDVVERLLATWPADERLAGRIVINELYFPAFTLQAARDRDPISNPLTVRLGVLYPKEDLREAQIKDAKTFLADRDRLGERLGPLLGKIVLQEAWDPVMTKAAQGKDLEPIEADRYQDLAKTMLAFAKIFDPKYQDAFLKVKVDLSAALDKLKETGEFQKKYMEAKDRNLKERERAVTSTCLSRLWMSIALNASGLRRKKALDMIPEVKAASIAVARSYFDPGSEEWLKNYIGSFEFALPDTRQEIYTRIRQSFNVAEGDALRTKLLRESSGPEADQVLLLKGLLDTVYNLDDKDDLEKDAKYGGEKQIVEACEKLPINAFSDFTVTSLGKISLSWFSLNNPEFAPAVIAHEIGHKLMEAARTQQVYGKGDTDHAFSESLTCVANRQPSLKVPVKWLAKDDSTQWSEEDWADHFSSQVMNELKRQNSPLYYKDNLGCALVSETVEGYQEDTLLSSEKDHHSNGITRVLQIGYDRGDLPASCMSLYRSETTGRQLSCTP